MLPPGGTAARALVCALAATLLVLAGCGKRESRKPKVRELTLEQLEQERDTTGLSRGGPLLRRFEPYRMENGAARVRGELALPEGTVLQVAVYRPGERWAFTRVQSAVQNGRFDTPPIIGDRGVLPAGTYRFELVVFFEESLQPGSVMRATEGGRSLRGPGITRDRNGIPAFTHAEDHRL